jgi:diguanylate cyclase (GGDEF)-like protein
MEMLYFSIRSFMNLSYFAVGLYDKNNCTINYFYIMDRQQKAEAKTLSIKDGQTFAGECIRNRKLIVINDISKEFDKYIDQTTHDNLVKLGNNSKLNSLIYCPLIMNTEIIGVFTIQSEEKDAFTEYHVEMVKSLSSYAAIAINNAIKSRELENLNQILLSLSEIDQLTGIANRRKFDEYMDDIWNDSMENGDSIALLIIDTDYFKEYNDNYGHLEGDKCLSSIARSLVDINIRPHFVARYGGDEFIIVLPKCSIDDAIKFGEIIKNTMAEINIPHEFSKVSDRVTLSIGIACVFPDKDTTIKQLIREADDGLYIAKKRGKNQAAAVS